MTLWEPAVAVILFAVVFAAYAIYSCKDDMD